MDAIQFQAVVDQEQVIRPPGGVILPQGEIEVTVRSKPASVTESADPLADTRQWLLSLAAEAEAAAPDLPTDLAANHDFYAHGKPRS